MQLPGAALSSGRYKARCSLGYLILVFVLPGVALVLQGSNLGVPTCFESRYAVGTRYVHVNKPCSF